MRLFGSPTLVRASRKDLAQPAGTFGAIVIVLLIGGCIAVLGMTGEKSCFVIAAIWVALGFLLIFIVQMIRWSIRRGKMAAAAEQAARERAAFAAEEAKEARARAAVADAAARVDSIRKGAVALAKRVHELGVERFVAEVDAVRASSMVTASEWNECRASVYKAVLWDFVQADMDLDETEDAALVALCKSFGLQAGESSSETEAIDQFRRFRDARLSVPVVESPYPLHKGEICHFAAKGMMKKPVGGAIRDGDVVLTSKRILIVSSGTIDLRLDKILRVDIEPYAGAVELTIDGRQNTVRLWVKDEIYFGLLVEHVGHIRREGMA